MSSRFQFFRLPARLLLAPGALLLALSAATAQVVPDVALTATTLPAGSELVRSYDADRVAVQVVSQPFFGATSAEWATLEVGPASLAFLREKNGGAVLLLGDQPLALPDALALGPDGRSAAPFSFELSYDRAQALAILAVGAQTFRVPAAAPPGPLTVVLAAGAGAEWRLDNLQITPGPVGLAATDFPLSAAPRSPRPAADSPLLTPGALTAALTAKQAALAQAVALFAAGGTQAAERVLEAASPRAKDSTRWHFEVAGGLVRLALASASRGATAPALTAAGQALARLDQAVARATPAENALAANALGLRGWLEERFLGDWSAAKASYQLAAQRWPQGQAGRQAERLEDAERESTLRGRGPGG